MALAHPEEKLVKRLKTKIVAINTIIAVGALVAATGAPVKWW